MDEFLEQTLLYDFYGELLTGRQKEIYEAYVLEDLSLGEIAGEQGISRQGVHDAVRRCHRTLKGYEEKLQLLEKFLTIKERVRQINTILDGCEGKDTHELAAKIRRISDKIIEEL